MSTYHQIMALTPAARECALSGLDEVSPRDLEAAFCESLDDCHDVIKIFDLQYVVSEVLAAVDPVAYRCMFADWIDGEDYVEVEGKTYRTSDVDQALEAHEEALA